MIEAEFSTHVWAPVGLVVCAEIVLTAQGHIIIFFHLHSLSRNTHNETVPIIGLFYGPKMGLLPASERDVLSAPVCAWCVVS